MIRECDEMMYVRDVHNSVDLGASSPDSDMDGMQGCRGHKRGFQALSSEEVIDQFDQFDVSLAPKGENGVIAVKLHRMWASLPEEVLLLILKRLPVAAQCRFRCVCPRWKVLLSKPSSAKRDATQVESEHDVCTIMLNDCSDEAIRFFSHAENKWYRIPFNPESCVKGGWHLVAADGGLVCYQSSRYEEMAKVLVCNPINGCYQVLPPIYFPLPPRRQPREVCWPQAYVWILDFWVDQKSNLFRVILNHSLLNHSRSTIMIFDSKTPEWKTFSSQITFPDERFGLELVWKNMIYIRTALDSIWAFDIESGLSNTMEVDLPCTPNLPYEIRCSNGYVTIVQFNPKKRNPIQIWMSSDDAKEAPTLSFSKWRKVRVEAPIVPRKDFWSYELSCRIYGNEFMFLTTGLTNQWIKYTFRTRTWEAMPRTGSTNARASRNRWQDHAHEWWEWKPRIDLLV